MRVMSESRAVVAVAFAMTTTIVAAQPGDREPTVADLQKNIDLFSGVLAGALDLEQETGLFGISLGNIDSTYLWGQGVVLEVRTPLSSRRNYVNLASLSSTLQNLQARGNPFAALTQSRSIDPAAPRVLSLATAESQANDFYREMMDRIANVDYSLTINTAIQQASEYARSLRLLDNVDDKSYEALRSDIDALRGEIQQQFARLRELETQLDSDTMPADAEQDSLKTALDSVLDNLEPLRDRALAKAEELRARSQVAEAEYATSWRQQVSELEVKLFEAMCDYGSMLRELPITENVSVILSGLGDDTGSSRRADKVHVFRKADLVECQSGEIDAAMLEQRAAHYSY
jgi:hypothetical protein